MSSAKRNPIMKLVPIRYRMVLRRLIRLGKYKGNKRYCPICENNLREFLTVDIDGMNNKCSPFKIRNNTKCPVCGSIERYRSLYLYLKEKTDIFMGISTKNFPQV